MTDKIRFWIMVGFTLTRSFLLMFMIALATNVFAPVLASALLGLNTGLRKDVKAWVLVLMQACMILVFYFIFWFKNPKNSLIQFTSIANSALATIIGGLCPLFFNWLKSKYFSRNVSS